ncbi:MAG: CCA tRNA nucleotidyltransferase [Planctomycetes bacterium]|nr:CCA tRNA nucleotidyltransferase [Planctomycetota bacterium]
MDVSSPSPLSAGDPDLTGRARALASAVREAGGRALVVGGWTRDLLLGRDSKDIDLEVYGLAADLLRQVLARFGPVQTVGESFTVYKVGGVDVALPRRESKVGVGHRGFEVRGDPFMPVNEAARRRDFTVNAIAWDPLTDEVIDPFGGRADLGRRMLRAVDPRTFGNDSLRVLRAVQLAARLDFAIDEATRDLCRAIPLDDLPAERIWGEVEKLLLASPRPSVGFRAALDLGVIDRLFPEMAALVGCQQEPDWHPEGDVWVHTLMVIDETRQRSDDLPRSGQLALLLGAVCHDLGKPETTAFLEGRIRSYNHEDAGVAPTLRLLDHLNVHAIDGVDVRRQVVGLVAHHLKPGMWFKARERVGDGAFRRLAQKVDLELLARLATADCVGRTGLFDCRAMEWFLERARSLGVEHRPPRPLLLGRHLLDLGVRPGPRMGVILRDVYERQLDGEVTTTEQALAAAKRILDAPAAG